MSSGNGISESMKLRALHLGELRGEERIIYLYRFVSWTLTSFVYVVHGPKSDWIIVLSLLFESIFVSDLYVRNRDKSRFIVLLSLFETILIAALVARTGGIESPFIWFALNPVLVTATLVNGYYSWANLMVYALAAVASYEWLFPEPHLSILALVNQHLTVILILVLLTLAIRLYAAFASQLAEKSKQLSAQQAELSRVNHELAWANQKLAESCQNERSSMQEIISLYQAVQEVTSEDDIHALTQIIADYTFTLTNRKKSFVFIRSDDKDNTAILKTHPEHIDETDRLSSELAQLWDSIQDLRVPMNVMLAGTNYMVVMVRSSSTRFALLGYEAFIPEDRDHEASDCPNGCTNPLMVLSEISAVILERRRLEKIAQQLLVTEEQNRIASEMHDNVSQRLFSMVYALHALNKSWPHIPPEQVQEQLNVISKTAQLTTKEFRQTIYRLSNRHQPERSLRHKLGEYLDEVRDLNGISLHVNIDGTEQYVPPPMKPVIYRIVAEAVGNAIRHGQCTELRVQIRFGEADVDLRVEDNGCGFNPTLLFERKFVGLGIQNMKSLVQGFAGTFEIESAIGRGTAVRAEMKYPQFQLA